MQSIPGFIGLPNEEYLFFFAKIPLPQEKMASRILEVQSSWEIEFLPTSIYHSSKKIKHEIQVPNPSMMASEVTTSTNLHLH